MKMNIAFSFLALGFLGAAEDIDEHDVPQACVSDCRSLIDLSARCESTTDGDSAFNDCVCGDSGAEPAFNSCAGCAKQNGFTANDDNDVASLMTDCGLDFNAASASGSSSGNNTGSVATNTITSVSGSSTVVVTTTTSAPAASLQTSGSEAGSTDESAAAGARATAGIGAVVAGLALGLPALI